MRVTSSVLRRLISNMKRDRTGDGSLNPGLRMAAGAIAGIIAMSSTYHLDMVRGRLTCQEGKTNQQYTGIVHAYKEIIRTVRFVWSDWACPVSLNVVGKRGHQARFGGRMVAAQIAMLSGTRAITKGFATSARVQ